MALGSAAAIEHIVNIAAANLGVTIGAPPAQELLGLGETTTATVPLDLTQGDRRTAASVDNAPPPIAGPQ